MLECFRKKGKASFILGGQFGSEAKGAASAFLATHLRDRNEGFDIITANNGAQSGHVSVHEGKSLTLFHLPTAAAYPQMFADGIRRKFQPLTYLNGGAIIDVDVLLDELDRVPGIADKLCIHPNAAIVTPECREAEMRDNSQQTKIAGTRKGVGEALSRKILRSAPNARGAPRLARWIERLDLNDMMQRGASVLVEVPQGHSLSLDGPFYPHVTSRNCTVGQAMSDAGIHPHFYHASMMVIRTFPIRVGAITRLREDAPRFEGADKFETLGTSGSHFPDQREISWADLGVKAEITTVTKRVRRVFTFSEQQVAEAIAQTRPGVIYLTFCDYLPRSALDFDPDRPMDDRLDARRGMARLMVDRLREMCNRVGSVRHDGPEILTQWGPTTADVIRAEDL